VSEPTDKKLEEQVTEPIKEAVETVASAATGAIVVSQQMFDKLLDTVLSGFNKPQGSTESAITIQENPKGPTESRPESERESEREPDSRPKRRGFGARFFGE
jgi:hypothetical protein